ncbi:MAG: helix-hairpin-helix domain-containing protein [Nocardioides sp.]
MISAITGRLRQVGERSVALAVGAIEYELLVPSSDLQSLTQQIGSDVTFHTIFYLEGDPSRGGLEPRLIGFSTARDKAFFEKFTTVKGIGTKTVLRALSVPAVQIAAAIESRNTRFLTQLEGIGKRTAELIVAELSGKVGQFAAGVTIEGTPEQRRATAMNQAELDAINAMLALGERRPDAERLLETVRHENPTMATTDALLRDAAAKGDVGAIYRTQAADEAGFTGRFEGNSAFFLLPCHA